MASIEFKSGAPDRPRRRRARIQSETVPEVERPYIPSGIVARLLNATGNQILKLRGSGTRVPAVRPSVGSTTRDHYYSFVDLVRLAVLWHVRDFIGLKDRKRLWRLITTQHVELATRRGAPLFLVIQPPSPLSTELVVSIRKIKSGKRLDLPEAAVIVNLSSLAKELRTNVNQLIELNQLQGFRVLARHAPDTAEMFLQDTEEMLKGIGIRPRAAQSAVRKIREVVGLAVPGIRRGMDKNK